MSDQFNGPLSDQSSDHISDQVSDQSSDQSVERGVRVRFAPSPSGDLHVGNVRTALFNWAFARHHGGTFVFRVEDTDRSRTTDEAYHAALDTLRWLGLDWDEGPEVGGPYAPYRQSDRLEIYAAVAATLQEQGAAYPCYCSPEELAARREQARVERRTPGYDGHCRALGPDEVAAYEAQGRRPVLRFRMPVGVTTFEDLVRGEVSFDHENVPDFVLTRADGHPLYTLAASVDDVLMQITHVLRGEDLLSSTPRQIAMYAALGVPAERYPRFGHLPFVMGPDNTKLSKRHGEVSIAWYRREGFVPEAMDNYLALLGWSIGEDRESFTLAEMAAAFDIARVSKNPARFDVKKLAAINGEKIRGLAPADLESRLVPFLQRAGLVADPPAAQELALLRGALPLVATRMDRLSQVVDLLRFLYVDEAHFALDPAAAAKVLIPQAAAQLDAAVTVVEGLTSWSVVALQEGIDAALVERLGLSKRVAYAPLRVAVTGSSVAPPLFESMHLLGRERAVHRLRAALALINDAESDAGSD